MCSVVGCDSDPSVAPRFKLPKDPERRLEWVQFLATVNKQRFKESTWTDIAICSRHFTNDCFKNMAHLARINGKARLTLKPSAVPSACSQSGETPPSVEEEGVSTDSSDDVLSVYGQMHPKNVNFDLITEKATLLQMKRRYVVNEKRLLQLFSCICPICGSKTKVEKVTSGVLIILNQQCLHCEYRNQWKSQVNASVPAGEDQHLTVGIDITPEIQQAVATDGTHSTDPGAPETVAVVGEESDHTDETEESSEEGDMDSDRDWKPARAPPTETEEEDNEVCPPLSSKHGQLCTDCGRFFSEQRPHTCEHKIKPYACNICGKRYVSEVALNVHSKIHDVGYKHRCKYCYAIFKTMVDRVTHEKSHITEEKPYKCPDCSETFAKNMQRKAHLLDHRGPPQLKCHICGMEFNFEPYLQRHLAVHTGEKPFKCSVCQRGFKQASHLKSHVRLHTGERPYKCQHCDKSFNHNVSLKSHVQRYHATNSGCEEKSKTHTTVSDTAEAQENENNTGDAERSWNKTGTDSELGNVEEQESNQEVQKERLNVPKAKRRTTGRPIGRPKRNESGSLLLAVQVKGQRSGLETVKQQVQMLERKQCSDKDSQGDSDTSSDSAEKKEERSKKEINKKTRTRRKDSDSDSEYDPKENKKRRCRSQNAGKCAAKCSGRPKKNVVL